MERKKFIELRFHLLKN